MITVMVLFGFWAKKLSLTVCLFWIDTSWGWGWNWMGYEDVLARIGKARSAFNALVIIWRSREITTTTKLRIFNSNVKSVLLYGWETWRMTEKTVSKLQTFINRCLRRVLGIYWPATISNGSLWEATGQAHARQELTTRKWTWISHTLWRPNYCIAEQALLWNPQGSRRRGRPHSSWRRDTDHMSRGLTWHQLGLNQWPMFRDGIIKCFRSDQRWQYMYQLLCAWSNGKNQIVARANIEAQHI